MLAIRDFCQRRHIIEFALFGSILRADFNESSDFDVLAKFAPGSIYSLANRIDMGERLETLFGRKVDLIDSGALDMSRSDLRRKELLRAAQVICSGETRGNPAVR